MRTLLIYLLFAAVLPSSALADPACAVTIVRAPEDVRATVESWVAAEPRCATALEVRIVPTDGGLYLFAQDANGRTRERVVPDAQAAGVLVASWAADDSLPHAAPPPVAAEVEPPIAPPSLIEPRRSIRQAAPSPSAPSPSRWLTLGAMAQFPDTSGHGLRLELDLITRGHWSLGLAAAFSSEAAPDDGQLMSRINWRDESAVLLGSRTFGSGLWRLRTSLGLGLVYTSGVIEIDSVGGTTSYQGAGMSASVELAAVVSRDLGRDWGAIAGLVLDIDNQSFSVADAANRTALTVQRGLGLMGLFGIRHRL